MWDFLGDLIGSLFGWARFNHNRPEIDTKTGIVMGGEGNLPAPRSAPKNRG